MNNNNNNNSNLNIQSLELVGTESMSGASSTESTAVASASSSTAIKEYCENEFFVANCGNQSAIIITHALYGRMSIGKCLKNYQTGCAKDVKTQLERLCGGRSSCRVAVSGFIENATSVPCPVDLRSYLEAAYVCVDAQCTVYVTIKEKEPDGQFRHGCRVRQRENNMLISSAQLLEVSSSSLDSHKFIVKYEVVGCKDPELPSDGWMKRDDYQAVVGCSASPKEQIRITCNGTHWSHDTKTLCNMQTCKQQ
ncbi:hypothetical protein HELRODRAFT_160833 [Helobdella robusta]|uniref:SUEL-type lectin domain-containing protein n=1 Tax=Helobdella robusta TaxID=6412 RepID=T1EQS7_HELRO|nr:hypothetical protein HELRODRAFT_160833 [Helobdella robusta]ESO06643.1 hypothetical protein HELRODRAFT_160833 [Helobdella robusta]